MEDDEFRRMLREMFDEVNKGKSNPYSGYAKWGYNPFESSSSTEDEFKARYYQKPPEEDRVPPKQNYVKIIEEMDQDRRLVQIGVVIEWAKFAEWQRRTGFRVSAPRLIEEMKKKAIQGVTVDIHQMSGGICFRVWIEAPWEVYKL